MTEDDIRDDLMRSLFQRFGKPDSWTGTGKSATFELARHGVVGSVYAERPLNYTLPGGKAISHCSDILAVTKPAGDAEREECFTSIEIKHRSAVTDQFKCRSYDMLHMKQQYGETIFGIMVFARAGTGISLAQARAICHPFDAFVGVDTLTTAQHEWWQELFTTVERWFEKSVEEVAAYGGA